MQASNQIGGGNGMMQTGMQGQSGMQQMRSKKADIDEKVGSISSEPEDEF